ncbi:anaerobic ribonucleoside-triphosphate reductase activating protein [Candidatus Pacearchaeota archaeon]|nr:anaerobic ribonucleoside-triphosphate reductase activating protein [Candidatus Pacearchaeota archaeon]
MKIKHLQKTTLIDYPGNIACTIFLFGCNFKCGFCHNPELVIKEKEEHPDISKQEVLDFLEKRKNQLEGICITGGEPCLSLEKDFLKKIKKKGYKIKLDTNGSFPNKLKEFFKENLIDFVSMDVKSSFDKYNNITNSKIDIEKIKKSIKAIHKNLGDLKNYEFRTTILEGFHNEEEFEKMMKDINNLLKGEKVKKFALQGFRNNGKLIDKSYYEEPNTRESYLLELKKIAEPYCEKVEIRR